ncbi:MAG: hypothetical protein K2W81_12860 [Sphingomonas sp.]|uniref:hypothetical protein n=1 Tax=Sphingomonas sp. TaxID=28214 RepID=UPI0025FA10DE|nr:hypothetical protein [Sphingomonas sp.]MBY0284837.1 hypothetical protein [Sphingomonas sp.]
MRVVSNKKSAEATQSIQRVKVGMTGLAFVLLLIGLASAIFSSASHERPVAVAGGAKADIVANLSATNGTDPATTGDREPLAELGIAPSAAGNTAAPAKPAK